MGFATDRDDALNLDPVKAGGWDGILKNWDGILDPRLATPPGVSDWETYSAGLTCAEIAQKTNVADEDRWDLLEACGLVPYKPGRRKKPLAEQSAVIKYPVPGQ